MRKEQFFNSTGPRLLPAYWSFLNARNIVRYAARAFGHEWGIGVLLSAIFDLESIYHGPPTKANHDTSATLRLQPNTLLVRRELSRSGVGITETT